MLSVPCIEVVVFWGLLRHQKPTKKSQASADNNKPSPVGKVNESFCTQSESGLEKDVEGTYTRKDSGAPSVGETVVQWVDPTKMKDSLKDVEKNAAVESKFTSIGDKLKYLPHLCKHYMAPLLFIYFSQYFINQGLVSLIYPYFHQGILCFELRHPLQWGNATLNAQKKPLKKSKVYS